MPKYEEQLFNYEEMVRLEQNEKKPESLLFGPARYVIGDDGRFYVADYRNFRIVVFDEEGRYVRSIGRDGEGPGEFRGPNLLWVDSGKLAVYDFQLRRTSLFTTEGLYLRQYSYTPAGYGAMAVYPLEDGRLVVTCMEGIREQPDEMLQKYSAIIVTGEGDTLGTVQVPPFSFGKMIMLEQYRTGFSATVYFGPRSSLSYYRGLGILCYSSTEPVMRWYDLEGKLSRVIRIEMEPEPVTEEEKRGIYQYLQSRIDEATDERRKAIAEGRKKYAVIPDKKSYWSGVSVDDAGYHWIGRHYNYTVSREEYFPTYILLSPEGEYLGDVKHPEHTAWVSRGCLLSYREDEETGEMSFIVYRMTPAVEGLVYP